MPASSSKHNGIILILPHQNERPTAARFMRALRRGLEADGIPAEAWLIHGSSSRCWSFRQKLAVDSLYPLYPRNEISKLTSFSNFALIVADVVNRARTIAQRVSENPGALVVEIHSWVPDKNGSGSGGLPEKDLGNGLSLLNFSHVMNSCYKWWLGEEEKLLSRLAGMIGFDINVARDFLFGSLAPRIKNHAHPTLCLEVPAARAVPMLVKGRPAYNLYFEKGELLGGITDFEQLYCLNAICGSAYGQQDVAMAASLLANRSGQLY